MSRDHLRGSDQKVPFQGLAIRENRPETRSQIGIEAQNQKSTFAGNLLEARELLIQNQTI
ncbi:MAG: hypothetical protein CV045_07515 [Cyanobacteria bacterium M5B4]|nr:MAG: hypothetical protein CV045_07515 [Cyanobacteria bacterium M5B4]